MKGGTFLSQKDYDVMKQKIETDYDSIIASGAFFEKTYTGQPPEDFEVNELQYKAIICMIHSATEIECISVSSLVGFILRIKSSKSYFKKLDTVGEEIEVYDILLKISCIGDSDKPFYYTDTEGKTFKRQDTIEHVKFEVKEQQSIYNHTFETGFIICPSILDVTILENNAQINTFFELTSITMDTRTKQLVEFFKNYKDGKISIVTCEYLDKSKTLFDCKHKFESADDNTKYNIIAYLTSIILALMVYCGIIHRDLHTSNIMVMEDIFNKDDTADLKNKIHLIDFGTIQKSNKPEMNKRFDKFFTTKSHSSFELQYDTISKFITGYYVKNINNETDFGYVKKKDFENEYFKERLHGYCQRIFENIKKEELHTFQTKQKKLIKDFVADVRYMIKGTITFTDGGKSKKRAKKHHKKTQRRKRS